MPYSYFAVPTPETKRRFQSIFRSCPFTVDFDQIAIRIALHVQREKPAPDGTVYAVRTIGFGHHYNVEMEYSELVSKVTCPALMVRHQNLVLGKEDDYAPAIIFQSPATPLANSNKFFIASIANTLATREEHPFTFVERVLSE